MKASIQRRDRRRKAVRRKQVNGTGPMQLPQIQGLAGSVPALGENELPFIRALPNGTHIGQAIKVSKDVWVLGAQFMHNFDGRFLICKNPPSHPDKVEVIAARFAPDGEVLKIAEEHVPDGPELPLAIERVIRAAMKAMEIVK